MFVIKYLIKKKNTQNFHAIQFYIFFSYLFYKILKIWRCQDVAYFYSPIKYFTALLSKLLWLQWTTWYRRIGPQNFMHFCCTGFFLQFFKNAQYLALSGFWLFLLSFKNISCFVIQVVMVAVNNLIQKNRTSKFHALLLYGFFSTIFQTFPKCVIFYHHPNRYSSFYLFFFNCFQYSGTLKKNRATKNTS